MRKMRQFIGLSVMMSTGLSAFAQEPRSCDLQVTINSPANNEVIPPNDTAWLEFTVENDGPDAILATDTLWFWDQTNVFPFLAVEEIPAKQSRKFTRNELGLRFINNNTTETDNSGQFCMKLVNQSTIMYSQTTGPVVTFEDPDTANNWSCVSITLKGQEPSSVLKFNEDKNTSLNLYPNPAYGEVKFFMDLEQIENVFVSLKDISGREVFFKNFGQVPAGTDIPFHLNVGGLSAGMYLVELNAGAKKAVGKLMVKH